MTNYLSSLLAVAFFACASLNAIGAGINVAAQANGGVATASSSYRNYPAANANNGERTGHPYAGSFWLDNTGGLYPDWLQIAFSGQKSINEIDVFTVQDNNTTPVEPTAGMTFTKYGITTFEVQYWNGTSWLTVPGGSVSGNNLVWRKITFSPITTDRIRVLVNASLGGFSAITELEVYASNQAPTVSLLAPAATDSFTAPATLSIIANAADSDGSIQLVEFYNGATLLGSKTQSPFMYDWANVPAGSYTLSAKAFDNANASTTSAPVTITVNAPQVAASIYYIFADHLNTPRVITDQSNKTIWRWDSDAFGTSAPLEDPDGDGVKFTYNLRFPGQYYDKETALHYNYQRDGYDPSIGRYTQADPIGIIGSLNLYGYANQNPLSFIDPTGEAAQLAWCFGGPVPCAIALGSTGVAMGMMSQSTQNSKTGSTSATTSSSQEQCCTEFKKIYDSGDPNRPKHGANGYWGSNGNWVSPAPINGQAALNNSVAVGGRNRVGFDPMSGQVVEFRLTRRDEVNCIEYWHGFVINNQPVPMDPAVRNAARNAGFPTPKK